MAALDKIAERFTSLFKIDETTSPQNDYKYLKFLSETEVPDQYASQKENIINKYGSETEFLNQVFQEEQPKDTTLVDIAKSQPVEKIPFEELLKGATAKSTVSDADTITTNTGDTITTGDALKSEIENVVNNTLAEKEDTNSMNDNIVEMISYVSGLDDRVKERLQGALGIKPKKSFLETIVGAPEAIYQTLTERPETLTLPNGRDIQLPGGMERMGQRFEEGLQDPKTQFFINLAKRSGQSSFTSPFGRVFEALEDTSNAMIQSKLLDAKLVKGTTGLKDKKTDYVFGSNPTKDAALKAALPGMDFVNKQTYIVESNLNDDGSFGSIFSASIKKDPKGGGGDELEGYYKDNFKEIIATANGIGSERNAIMSNINLAKELAAQGATEFDKLVAPVASFVRGIDEGAYLEMMDAIGKNPNDIANVNRIMANTFQAILPRMKELYPISNKDVENLIASFPNDAFGFAGLSAQLLAFNEYAQLYSDYSREYVDKAGKSSGTEYEGYMNFMDYARNKQLKEVSKRFKNSGITDEMMKSYGFVKEKDYGTDTLPEDYTPMAKLMALNGTKVADQMGIDPIEVFKGKEVSKVTTPEQYWNSFKNAEELQNAFDNLTVTIEQMRTLDETGELPDTVLENFKNKYGFDAFEMTPSDYYYEVFSQPEED